MSPRRSILILVVCCLTGFLVFINTSIVNIALPAIRHSLDASLYDLQWIVNAYLAVLASLLILSGSLADRFGKARLFKIGLVVFGLGSLCCGLSSDVTWLIAFRAVQAIGASMLNPVAVSILMSVFTDRRGRAMAVSVWSAVSGVSLAVGPILGGVLVDSFGWRWVFLFNVPLVAVVLIATVLVLPANRRTRNRGFDPAGQALLVMAVGGITYGLIEGPQRGWLSTSVTPALILGVGALIALSVVERRVARPAINVRWFRNVTFTGAFLLGLVTFGAFNGFMFITTLYLQDTLGHTASQAGLYLLPTALAMTLAPALSGRLVARFGSRWPIVLGGLCLFAGFLLLLANVRTGQIAYLHAGFVLLGAGVGMINGPIVLNAVAGMPPENASVATAIASTSRQLGGALGVSFVGVTLPSQLGSAGAEDFAVATGNSWILLAGFGLAVMAIGWVMTTAWAGRTAERTTARNTVGGR